MGLSEEIDAAAALALVDLLDRAEVHRTLRIAFRLPRNAWDEFDRLFEEQSKKNEGTTAESRSEEAPVTAGV